MSDGRPSGVDCLGGAIAVLPVNGLPTITTRSVA